MINEQRIEIHISSFYFQCRVFDYMYVTRFPDSWVIPVCLMYVLSFHIYLLWLMLFVHVSNVFLRLPGSIYHPLKYTIWKFKKMVNVYGTEIFLCNWRCHRSFNIQETPRGFHEQVRPIQCTKWKLVRPEQREIKLPSFSFSNKNILINSSRVRQLARDTTTTTVLGQSKWNKIKSLLWRRLRTPSAFYFCLYLFFIFLFPLQKTCTARTRGGHR